jgi:hypothetical protein
MATTTWTGNAGDGKWETAGNWIGGVPVTASDVTLPEMASAYTVSISSAAPIASLTIGDFNFSNPITLILASGANLHATGAISFVGSAPVVIEGQGTLQADGGFTKNGGGASSILAGTATTGGTLVVRGALDFNIALGFANSSIATTLNIATANIGLNSFNITSSTQTLEISANVTFLTVATVTGGTIQIDGSTLTVGNGLTLSAGATLIGSGTLDSQIKGAGSVITAAGGTLTLTQAVSNDGLNPMGLVLGSGSTLVLSSGNGIGAVGSAPTLTFLGSGDIFQAVHTNLFGNNILIGKISNFIGGDFIKLGTFGPGDQIKSFDGINHTITLADSGGFNTHVFTFDSSTDVSKIQLTQELVDGVTSDVLTICFMAGTAIRTPEGEAPIETLKRGDLILTADGEAKPVVWIGLQTISSRFADPVGNWPIRIAAGALADNAPSCDLLVSPDHALLVEGILVHAGALVNGTSIRRERQVPEKFVYYHVELEDHSLLLAANVPAETFVDNVDRRNFDNWAEHEALYPAGRAVAELPLPRAKARRQVPVSIRIALDERAIAIQESVAA